MIKLHKYINNRERVLTKLLWIAGADGDVYGGRNKRWGHVKESGEAVGS